MWCTERRGGWGGEGAGTPPRERRSQTNASGSIGAALQRRKRQEEEKKKKPVNESTSGRRDNMPRLAPASPSGAMREGGGTDTRVSSPSSCCCSSTRGAARRNPWLPTLTAGWALSRDGSRSASPPLCFPLELFLSHPHSGEGTRRPGGTSACSSISRGLG